MPKNKNKSNILLENCIYLNNFFYFQNMAHIVVMKNEGY